MNREQAEALVVEATGRTDKTTLIRSALDLAVGEVSAQFNWSDLITEADASIAIGDGEVDLASDIARVLEARAIDGLQSQPLIVRPKEWLVRRVPAAEFRATGRPCYAYLEGQTLHLIPFSSLALTLRYTYCRLHPALSASSDVILIRHAAQAVVAYAIFWVFKSIEKHEDADKWLLTYGSTLMSAKKVDRGNKIIEHIADDHANSARNFAREYWLDPFCKRMP